MFSQRWSCLFVAFFLAGAFAHAESDKDLENQILSGAPLKPAEPLPEPETKASGNASTGAQAEADKKESVKKELDELEQTIRGPHEIPLSQILVVQYRYIHKEGAHELTPVMIGIQPADSFRRQFVWGFSYAYHLTEDWGIEVAHVMFAKNFSTGLSDNILSSTGLYTDRNEPVITAGSAILWTPLKSKAATGEDIHYFEGYFLAGGGATKFETTTAGMAMGGVGFRAYLSERSLFKVEVRDYLDFVGGTQQRFNIIAGASILLGGSR